MPEGATRVTFTLESDADVELLVRYGEDNDIQGGRLVFDYAADEVFAGTEEVIITPQSDPPLRAGTYFVSVVVFATGVVVNCELTAEVEPDGGSPPPTSDRTLTPGQPADFRLGPVDAARLFSGDDSFRLEVSENASRVIFTLESVDPDVDVDLYVRFGENNTIQDGRVVADYSSEGITGNERIVITPRSDPPLRDGTYFVSIALFDTGVVAEGTLTAEVERDDTPLPPISGGPLTPGQPTDFRLGPVDTPTLFAEGHSFQLEVSENASRVIFTLEPDADVGLLVRYGEDNDIQEGRLVFDYGSRNPEGNERIGITRRSDPPLRAGTYFVSALVFDTGVVAEGTLTAEVETDTTDCHLDVTCYPEWSSSATGVARIVIETSEGSLSCSGTLLNNSRQDLTPYFLTAAHCVATEEEARSVIAFWHYQTQTCNGELPDFQSVPRTEGARLLSTTGFREVGDPEGDMTLLRLEGDLPDGVMFQGWDADPQPVGTQVTGIHHPGSDDWGFFKRISFGQIIPDPASRISDAVYTFTSYTQGYTEPGSSGSALFSSPGTVVGALSFGLGKAAEKENACRTGRRTFTGYTHFSVFYPHIRQFIDKEFAGTESILLANFVNGNTDAFNSRVYLWNPSGSSGDVTVRVFTLPLTGGLAQELTTAPLNLGTLGAQSALNVKLVEDILAPLGITLPYTTDGGNLTLEFTIQAADVRGTAQVFSSSFAFGTYPLQNVELITDGGDVPPTPLAPADEAAFNTLFVGKRAVTNYPTFYVDFVSPGRFRETEGSDIWTGSYTYRNTGSNTGTLTLNYDDGDRCTVSLTFDSTTAGTASYTCNDGSSGEYNWQLVAISATGAPDLVIQTPSVSDSSPNAGESFTLSATVRNQGNGLSASTTLRYYRSTDATISTGDTQVGTDPVSGLSASGASDESLSLTAPSTAGIYYYGACVDPVSGESATGNNCSRAVTVTVAPPTNKPFNQLQTERLIGTWEFSYTIISDWTDWTDTYRLSNVQESSITPGEWNIFGTDESGDLVIAGYSPDLGRFSLLDPGTIIRQFFTFDFVGSNTVSGCYYQVDVADDSFSDCYPRA